MIFEADYAAQNPKIIKIWTILVDFFEGRTDTDMVFGDFC